MPIYAEKKYCVYLTVYLGNKLPPFYIGSTSIDRIKTGYHGSVKSKKYKDVFNYELNNNPHLFKTHIIATYYSRKMSVYKEKKLQTSMNVVKSDMYFNMSIAKDFGWFGMSNKKEDSPVYGKRWKKTPEQIENGRKAAIIAFNKPEHKLKMSKIRTGKVQLTPDQLKDKIDLYKRVLELYESRPELACNYIGKNGKLLTYEREFSKVYADLFQLTSTGLYNIITKDGVIKRMING